MFLDEIGDISPAFQAKLLRVLQEGEFERVGGSETLKVDVRFVFATNRNLEDAVERGAFRADLYYRINVVSILLPPLRERGDDTPLLALEFLRRFNEENGAEQAIDARRDQLLQTCYFPGNVRELENCVRRTATLSRADRIVRRGFRLCGRRLSLLDAVEGLRPDNAGCPRQKAQRAASSARRAPRRLGRRSCARDGLGQDSAQAGPAPDREKLVDAMEKAGWVQAKAARLLNLTPRQIAYALGKHNIPIKKFRHAPQGMSHFKRGRLRTLQTAGAKGWKAAPAQLARGLLSIGCVPVWAGRPDGTLNRFNEEIFRCPTRSSLRNARGAAFASSNVRTRRFR